MADDDIREGDPVKPSKRRPRDENYNEQDDRPRRRGVNRPVNIQRERPSHLWLWLLLGAIGVAVLFIGGTVAIIIATNRSKTAPRPSGDERAYLLERLRSPVRSIAVSPDGKTVAAGCHDGSIHIWDIVSGDPGPAFQGQHRGVISGLEYTPDGKMLVSASYDKTVMVWDATTGQLKNTLTGHKAAIWTLSVAAAGNRIASSAPFNEVDFPIEDVRVWDFPHAEEKDKGDLHKQFAGVTAVALSADGNRLFMASTDATVVQWDIAGRKSTALYKGPKDR